MFRVSPKRVHDASEVFDGVPSQHDRKAAWLIARLHWQGLSERWPLATEEQRTLRATLDLADHHDLTNQRISSHLEALCARHWPELPRLVELTRTTSLSLLTEFGSPAAVAARPTEAAAYMRRVSRGLLAEEKIAAVVRSAANQPMPMNAAEVELVKSLARDALKARAEAKRIRGKLERCLEQQHCPKPLRNTAGVLLAGALLAGGQDPRNIKSAAVLEKAAGLNLRERSSGTKKGGLHITKRGDGRLRRLLFMLALRMVKNDPIVSAWYQRKVERQGGNAKIKAVVAVMRKLIRVLWYVARGAEFDAAKLFDVRRLGLTTAA